MEELRKKIAELIQAGDKVNSIAKRFVISRKTVHKVKTFYLPSGDFSDRKKPGRTRTSRTPTNIEAVKQCIDRNPRNNIRRIAKDTGVPRTTVSTIVRQDLGLRSRACQKVQGLTELQRQKRLDRCKKILNMLKRQRNKVLIFSDEKIFTVDATSNSRSTRYIAKSPEEADPAVKYVGKTKHPAGAMMLGVIGSDGKAFPPYWTKGTVDSIQYKQLLSRKVFPALDATYGCGNWIWTQDGAPAHTSNAVQKYIANKLGSGGFWSKEVWPPNSPNLNPLDYFVWSNVESKACAIYHSNVEALKTSVEEEWNNMSALTLKRVCSRFRSRVERCIAVEGGVFEKK